MADKKISALTASTTPLAGTEVLPIVQSGATVKVAVSDLTAGRAVSATQLTLSTGNVIIATTAKGITTGSAIPLGFGVNNAVTAITIDTASKVGVGTTSPTRLLTAGNGTGAKYAAINGGATSSGDGGALLFEPAGTLAHGVGNYSAILGGAYSDSFMLYNKANSPMLFYTNNAERMRIDATGNIGIGTTGPAATALLDVQSTTKGVRFPNMTTAEKTAITPSAGTVIFDTTLAKLCVYSGSAWQTVTSI